MAANTETEDITSYRRDVTDVFILYYNRIHSVLKGSMEDFTSRAYSAHFISSQNMEVANIFEQFKTGFESCRSILEIQQRYKCFIDILLDIGGPVEDTGKEIEEKLSSLTVPCHSLQEEVPSIEPQSIQETTDDQWQPYDILLNDVLVRLENADDLKPIIEKLRRAFDLLVIEVENTLKAKNVQLHDVKNFINRKLHNIHIEEEQKLAEYRQKLYGIKDLASLFNDFLLKYYFISYLNYILLKDISTLAKDTSIASQFEEYKKSYVKLISTATFRDIMSVFDQNPHLSPTSPIGLPTVVFRLNNLWQDKTMFDFISSVLWGFSRYELLLLKELGEKCIIITYAVFPSVLSDVLEYFKSLAVQQKFQEMGIIVELPEYIDKEATDKVLVEKQEEIEKLTREKEATDKVLVEKQEEIEKLTREKEDPLLHAVTEQIESGYIVMKESVQTESVNKHDVSVQFNYLIPSIDSLKGVHIASEKLFLIQGDSPQFFDWEQYGLKMTILEGTLSPTDTSEVAISALIGGEFQFPEGTELISAVYCISVSKPLFRPVKIEIQHCADLVTQDHTSYLSFVTASLSELPYQFQLEEGGQFYRSGQYGSICLIYLSQFSLKAIVKSTTLKQSIQDTSLTSKSDFKVSTESIQDVMPFPDIKYIGQVVYEVKHLNSVWLMRFIVAKHLNALVEYIKKSLPNVDKDVSLYFTFEDDGYIELILNEEQDHPFNGWNIYSHQHPMVIYKSDVDIFGSEMPPQFPSVLITISAEYGPNTVTTLKYLVSLKGIKPDNTKIYIVRSISSASSNEGASSITSAFKSTSTRQNYVSVDSEQQQDQSSIDTLSEKLKLLEKMNEAKTLEIEKFTRGKESTDKVLVEKQEVIEKLTKEKEGKWWIIITFSIYILLLAIVITSFTSTDVKKAIPYIKRNVIGGTADIIQWADASFRMDIPPESFAKGHNVDILVSIHHSHQFVIPKGYKLFSQSYDIILSEKLQQPVTLTLKHNAVITTEEEAKSLVILHQNDKGETEILQGHTEPNSSFITFQLTELRRVAVAGPDDINTKCFMSFYRQNIRYYDNPHLKILALISQLEQNHKNIRDMLLNRGWIADDNPIPHNVEVNGTKLSLEVKPKGCWNITDDNQLNVTMTSEDDSNTGTVVMQWNANNCLVQQSEIIFHNTYDKREYNTFVNDQIMPPKLQDIIWNVVTDHPGVTGLIIALLIILLILWILGAKPVLIAILVFLFIVLTLVLLEIYGYISVLDRIGHVGAFLKDLLPGNR